MISSSNIEEYIVWIVSTNKVQLYHADTLFSNSIYSRILLGIGLTEKQFSASVRLVSRYKQQLLLHNITLPDVFTTSLGIRIIDKTKHISIVDDTIWVQCPYDVGTYADFKKASVYLIGEIQWYHTDAVWKLDISESNVSWIVAYAKLHQFTISAELLSMFEQIVECEKTDYAIKLVCNNGVYSITNAAESLNDYVLPFIDNRYMMIDHSGLLEYTIEQNIADELKQEKGDLFFSLCVNSKLHLPPDTLLHDVIDWAKVVNRLPVVVYSANAIKDDDTFKILETLCDTCVFIESKKDALKPAQIYYTSKMIDTSKKLVVSMQSMVFGNKRAWISHYEKIIFLCQKLG